MDLRRNGVPIYIHKDDFFTNRIFKTRFPKIYEDIEANGWFWESKSDVFRHLEEGNAVYARSDTIEMASRLNCSLRARVVAHIASRQQGFAMRKGHPLLRNISRQIIKYQAEGKIEDIVNRYSEAECSSNGPRRSLPQANLIEMRGLLVVTAMMAVLGVSVVFLGKLRKCKGTNEGKEEGKDEGKDDSQDFNF